MKKPVIFISAFFPALCLAGCSGKADIPDMATINGLVTEKGYTEEDILKELSGQSNVSLAEAWGTPDCMLFGLWGDIWDLGDNSGKYITVYYDSGGVVESIIIAEKSK